MCMQLAVTHNLPAFMAEHPNVRLLIIDSVAFHFRQDTGDVAQRVRTLAGLAQQLMRLAGEHDVAVGHTLFTAHAIAAGKALRTVL